MSLSKQNLVTGIMARCTFPRVLQRGIFMLCFHTSCSVAKKINTQQIPFAQEIQCSQKLSHYHRCHSNKYYFQDKKKEKEKEKNNSAQTIWQIPRKYLNLNIFKIM